MDLKSYIEAKKYEEIFKIPENGLIVDLNKCDFREQKFKYDNQEITKTIMTFEGNDYYIPARLFNQIKKLFENKITIVELKQIRTGSRPIDVIYTANPAKKL